MSERNPLGGLSESDRDFDPEKMSPEERRTYEAAMQAAKEDFEPDPETVKAMGYETSKAKYKIEIMFGPKRTMKGPNVFLMQVFESGKRLHGGGDDLAYWCQDVHEDVGCWGVIVSDWIRQGVAYCPNCEKAINASRLTCQRGGKLDTKSLAAAVAKIFRQLDHSADIYCKYNRDDIRVKILEEKVGAERARELRGLFIYPLKNILKDTAAGADLEKRFRAFFEA